MKPFIVASVESSMSQPSGKTPANGTSLDKYDGDTEDVQSDPVARRDRWLRRLADEFIKLESKFPVENFLPDDVPAWVTKLEREVGATMFPVAKLKAEMKLTPKRMGAILGHQCAIAVWMMEWLGNELEKPQAADDASLTPEQLQQGEKFAVKLVNEWYPALRRLAKRALVSCVDQGYDEMKDFLLGYANGFSQKPTGGGTGGLGNTAFEIYNFMLLYWRLIARLDSVHHLHEVFVKTFGPYRAGDLKRTEKICQRIGLSYRKPGRPKKTS